jgi:uroporphyrin-III C-methyltransferase
MCSFTLLSTHTTGPLQIGVTTNGSGCKLANRVKREIVASLPSSIGETCERMGRLRRRVQGFDAEEEEEEGEQRSSFNALVLPRSPEEDGGEEGEEGEEEEEEEDREGKARKRGRWLAQMCEYWPLERLCALTEGEAEGMFDSYTATATTTITTTTAPSQVAGKKKVGKILLVGSGPGHPDLLTLASKRALEEADLVLADKLVPSGVLELIPRRTLLFIARKFPGNADAAQEELLGKALAGLEEGKCVVRLKQGDPYIYGRGGEEVKFFEGRGYEPVVLPGITSALSAPLFAGVPATHRGVADQVLVCTGTGRRGAAPAPPEWVESRTVVFLMALHRLGSLVGELRGKGWPGEAPCAVVERASCKDQRVIRTTLERVVDAVEEYGSRPPGLLVVGRACEVLRTTASGKGWVVEEGFRGF